MCDMCVPQSSRGFSHSVEHSASHRTPPRMRIFLHGERVLSPRLRLILDAHASIALLAGAVLDLKSGVDIEFVQKGRAGLQIWRANDGTSATGPAFEVAEETVGGGRDIAIAISVVQSAVPQARAHVANNLPEVGRLVAFSPKSRDLNSASRKGFSDKAIGAMAFQTSRSSVTLSFSLPSALPKINVMQ